MNATQLYVPLPHHGLAVLTLAQPISSGVLLELEHELVDHLGRVRQALPDPQDKAGEIEYASWLRQLSPTHAYLLA